MNNERDTGQSSTPQGSDTLLDVLNEAAEAGFGAQFIARPDGLVECGADPSPGLGKPGFQTRAPGES